MGNKLCVMGKDKKRKREKKTKSVPNRSQHSDFTRIDDHDDVVQYLTSENESLKRKVQGLESELESVKHGKVELENRYHDERGATNLQIQNMKVDNNRYRDEREATRQESHQIQVDNNRKVTQLEHDKSEFAKRCQELQSVNQQLQRSKEDTRYHEEKDAARQELQQIQADNNRYREERDAARQEIQQIQTDNNRKVTQLEHDKSEFAKRCQELQSVNQQLQRSKEDTRYHEEKDAARQELHQIQADNNRYSDERDAARQEIHQMQAHTNRYRDERNATRKEIHQNQADNNRKVTQLEHDKSEFAKRCQELENMNQHLQRSKEEIATRKVTQLEHDKSEFAKVCQELQSVNQQLQRSKEDMATRYHEERDAARQEIQQIQVDNNRKVTQLEHDKSEFAKMCQELQSMNQQLQRSKEDMATRLAQEMGNKLAADESSVENVSIKNRPMNIADDYNLFCSNEWLDAKTAVDDKMGDVPEHNKIQMLHHILLVAYAEADAVIVRIEQNTDTLFRKLYAPDQFCTEEDPLHSPLGNLSNKRSTIATDSRKVTPSEIKKLTQSAVVPIQSKKSSKMMLEATEPRAPTELTNSVGDFLRKTADIVHLDGIVQHVLRKLDEESQSLTATSPGKGKKGDPPAQTEYMQLWPYVREEAHVKHYIIKAVKLVWKMVIQRPKMNFAPAETEWRGEKYQDVYWGSDMTAKKPLVYEVFPRVCHGERAMSKAKVYLVKP